MSTFTVTTVTCDYPMCAATTEATNYPFKEPDGWQFSVGIDGSGRRWVTEDRCPDHNKETT